MGRVNYSSLFLCVIIAKTSHQFIGKFFDFFLRFYFVNNFQFLRRILKRNLHLSCANLMIPKIKHRYFALYSWSRFKLFIQKLENFFASFNLFLLWKVKLFLFVHGKILSANLVSFSRFTVVKAIYKVIVDAAEGNWVEISSNDNINVISVFEMGGDLMKGVHHKV